jgi:glycosyltransferase involved in cell wall biosynthesis
MSDYYEFDPEQCASRHIPFGTFFSEMESGACQNPIDCSDYPEDYDSCREVPGRVCDYDIPVTCQQQVVPEAPNVVVRPPDGRFAGPRRPLRLAFVGPPLTVGGVEQHTRALAKFLDPNIVCATKYVIAHDRGSEKRGARDSRLPVDHCDPSELLRATEDCDVVLVWGMEFNNWLRGCGAIRVFLAHGESGWTRRCLESSSQVIDHVVAVSQRVKQRVCRGFPTTVILNGVDAARLAHTQARSDFRAQYGFRDDEFVVGSLGRFTREKRVDLLISAVAELPACFKLLVVGCGRRKQELLELANDRISGRYALVSANDYLGDYYGAMDAFALLSEHEGFGLVVPEAMLCHCPVIATDVGCVPEVIQHKISGIVVPPDVRSIANAIRQLRNHPAWAKAMATEAHQFASKHLHAARMARDYEQLLCQLAQQRKESRQ